MDYDDVRANLNAVLRYVNITKTGKRGFTESEFDSNNDIRRFEQKSPFKEWHELTAEEQRRLMTFLETYNQVNDGERNIIADFLLKTIKAPGYETLKWVSDVNTGMTIYQTAHRAEGYERKFGALQAAVRADKNGWTDLMTAIEEKRSSRIKELLQAGAHPNAITNIVYEYDQRNKKFSVVKQLDKTVHTIAVKDSLTPLIIAAQTENKEAVDLLLEQGADLNLWNRNGSTALMYAVQRQLPDMISLLLEKGADVNGRGIFGRTALMLAAKEGQIEMAQMLIEKGADITAKDEDEESVLMYTLTPIAVGNEGLSVLENQTRIAQNLIDKGVDLNVPDENGDTPLMFAVRNGHAATAKTLIEKGVNVSALNKKGEDALKILKENEPVFPKKEGYKEVLALLNAKLPQTETDAEKSDKDTAEK